MTGLLFSPTLFLRPCPASRNSSSSARYETRISWISIDVHVGLRRHGAGAYRSRVVGELVPRESEAKLPRTSQPATHLGGRVARCSDRVRDRHSDARRVGKHRRPTNLLWATTITLALRRIPRPPAPCEHSRSHKTLGWLSVIDLVLTSATGLAFYYRAFVI